eukprot:TRINITY_DN8035_c0_g2_i1.p1 TRINITY_DN8035_c0_g2~~TRINITY_DN8035_c0_g2_i1.p1  ORF type:complete len:216 (+),score=64.37 TRINITY_DN8035_c0_g2_i1:216-863(+)
MPKMVRRWRRKKKSNEEAKKKRWRPGTVALREIFKLQKTSKLLLQKAPFQRLVRDIMNKYKAGLSFKPSAFEAMQEATESYMVKLFQAAVMMQIHRKKHTLSNLDLIIARRVRGELHGIASNAICGIVFVQSRLRRGITKGSIRRLARRGGCKRISKEAFNEARGILTSFVNEVITDTSTLMELTGRKTVRAEDVLFALRKQGRTLYTGLGTSYP